MRSTRQGVRLRCVKRSRRATPARTAAIEDSSRKAKVTRSAAGVRAVAVQSRKRLRRGSSQPAKAVKARLALKAVRRKKANEAFGGSRRIHPLPPYNPFY